MRKLLSVTSAPLAGTPHAGLLTGTGDCERILLMPGPCDSEASIDELVIFLVYRPRATPPGVGAAGFSAHVSEWKLDAAPSLQIKCDSSQKIVTHQRWNGVARICGIRYCP